MLVSVIITNTCKFIFFWVFWSIGFLQLWFVLMGLAVCLSCSLLCFSVYMFPWWVFVGSFFMPQSIVGFLWSMIMESPSVTYSWGLYLIYMHLKHVLWIPLVSYISLVFVAPVNCVMLCCWIICIQQFLFVLLSPLSNPHLFLSGLKFGSKVHLEPAIRWFLTSDSVTFCMSWLHCFLKLNS